MAWQLARPGATTVSLAPYDTSASREIDWSELLPGDALNVHEEGLGHVMLFGGWRNAAHTSACVIQENQSGTPANLRGYTSGWLDRFTPIRAKNLGQSGGSSSASPASPASPGAQCWSPTLGAYTAQGACVQSASNEVWYQCVDGDWARGVADGDGPMGPCTESHPL